MVRQFNSGFKDICKFKSNYNSRSISQGKNAETLKINEETTKKSARYLAHKLYNMLPGDMLRTNNLIYFKKRLKKLA